MYAPARAQTQADYDAAIHSLFTGLDKVSYAVLHLHQGYIESLDPKKNPEGSTPQAPNPIN